VGKKKKGRESHQHCQRHRDQLIIYFVQQPLPLPITNTPALHKGGEKKNETGETREEKEEQRREHSEKFRKNKRRAHEDIETKEQRNSSRRNRTAKPKRKDSRGG